MLLFTKTISGFPINVKTRNRFVAFRRQQIKTSFFILFFSTLITCFHQKAYAQIITTIAGQQKVSCTVLPCGEGGLAKDANLYSPSGINVDHDGNIYIAEFSNHAVRKIDITTGIITTYAGTQRTACAVSPCGDGGLATNALLNGPRGIGVDSYGNIYIADFSNHVIRKIDINTGIITTVAGTMRTSCSTAPCGNGGLATSANLNSPTSVDFDSEGHMYIADYGNHNIRRVDKNTGIITTYAGTMKLSCSAAPCGDGNPATSAIFNGPSGIAFDSNDNLYISEYGNHSVRKVDRITGIMTTVAGNQRASCSVYPCGDGGPATSINARLTSPFSLTIGPDDNLYIADASNSAIRKVDLTTNIITTVAGIVKSSCGVVPCGDGGLATNAQLSNPFGVRFSPEGSDMYILEYSNQALRKVTPTGIITLPVTMQDIVATRKGTSVELTWKSIGEEMVDRYEIQRSQTETGFTITGQVIADAHETGSKTYKWTDHNPAQGFNYYRIKSIDKDGSFLYSKIVYTGFTKGSGIVVSPNPVTERKISVTFTSPMQQQVELLIFNSGGQKIWAKKFIGTGHAQTETLELPAALQKGIYMLYLGNEKEEIGREKIILH